MEINKTVIVVSRWFLYYLTYIDDARSNTNQVDHSSPSSAEVKNEWSYTSVPHICLYGVKRDFTFFFTFYLRICRYTSTDCQHKKAVTVINIPVTESVV